MAITLPHDAMAQMFEAQPANDLPDLPNYNVCPTVQIAVVTSDPVRRYRPMRWGFVPHWYKEMNGGPLLINARSETIAEKPAFKAACRERRCLIGASGFYEWTRLEDGTKLPWYITRTDGDPIVFAGVWQEWQGQPTCAVVTCAANTAMSEIHHRLPVILEREDWGKWLGEAGRGAAPLMKPTGEDTLQFRRVSTAVNSNRATGPELIEPFEGDEE